MEPQALADRGTITMDGRQPACVRQWAADVAWVQQHAAEWRVCGNVQWQQWWRKGRWDGRKITINNNYGDGQLWVKAGVGGRSG